MKGKTIAFVIVSILLVCAIGILINFNNENYSPAIITTNPEDTDNIKENCIKLTARELYEMMLFDQTTKQVNPPRNVNVKSATTIGVLPKNWKIYAQSIVDGGTQEQISHDPPPQYLQSAQIFNFGAAGSNEDFYLTCISVELSYFSVGSGTIYCDVRSINGLFPRYRPSDTTLGEASLYDDGTFFGTKFWNFTFSPPVLIDKDSPYSFVLRIPSSGLCKSLSYGNDSYPGGYRCRTTNGYIWILDEENDLHNWIIYGLSAVDETKKVDVPFIYLDYPEIAEGDCIIIHDAISLIQYYPDDDYTSVCFSWYQNTESKKEVFYKFKGDITDIYKKGDVVEITLHLKHIELETTDVIFDIDVFEEQWESEQFFIDNVEDVLIDTGLRPMDPDIMYCRRNR
jgi:hypothetical protein